MKVVKEECSLAFSVGVRHIGSKGGRRMVECSVILCSKKWLCQKKNVWRTVRVITQEEKKKKSCSSCCEWKQWYGLRQASHWQVNAENLLWGW